MLACKNSANVTLVKTFMKTTEMILKVVKIESPLLRGAVIHIKSF